MYDVWFIVLDLITDSQQAEIAEHLQCQALLSLEQHVSGQLNRMSAILLILPVLHTPSIEELTNVLFAPIIGNVSMDAVIVTM